MKKKNLIITIFAMLATFQWLLAETVQESSTPKEESGGFSMTDVVLYALIGLVVILIIRVINELFLMRRQIRKLRRDIVPGAEVDPDEDKDMVQVFLDRFYGLKPMSMEGELVMDDHEYDGIKELSNGMPPWLQAFFGVTIVFAIVYFTWYIVLEKGPDQYQEYQAQMDIANKQKEERLKQLALTIDENNVTLLTDETEILAGKQTFTNLCATCHGTNGEGKDGPNLTDQYWIHGGGINNVFKTIKYGVAGKTMIAWQEMLDPLQIQRVASYVISLEGSNPPDQKGPEGTIWTPDMEVKTDSLKVDSILTPNSDTIVKK